MGFAELFSVMATLSAEKLAEKKFGKRRVAAASEQAGKPSETVSEVETVMRSAAPALGFYNSAQHLVKKVGQACDLPVTLWFDQELKGDRYEVHKIDPGREVSN
jgi:hypothetical protein